MRYLLGVDFRGGVVDTPMSQWEPAEIEAHLAYYRELNRELVESGELVGGEVLAGPDTARVVTSDGTRPVVTDGPFGEIKEWLAGYQIVEVDSEELAARVSAVPGPGGKPTQQPIQVRRILDQGPSDADEMGEWLKTAGG